MSYRAMDGLMDTDKWWTENRLKHNAISAEVNLTVPCCLVDSRQG